MVGVLRGKCGRAENSFAVDREHRRSGLGSMMLAEIEETFFGQVVQSEWRILNCSPYYFTPGLDPRYTEAFCFLQSRGYTAERLRPTT